MISPSKILSEMHRRFTANRMKIRVRNMAEDWNKTALILQCYEQGIFTSGDVERLYSENKLRGKED